jgi:hypothetical protein
MNKATSYSRVHSVQCCVNECTYDMTCLIYLYGTFPIDNTSSAIKQKQLNILHVRNIVCIRIAYGTIRAHYYMSRKWLLTGCKHYTIYT